VHGLAPLLVNSRHTISCTPIRW